MSSLGPGTRLTRAQHSIHEVSSTLVVKTAVRGYHVYTTLRESHIGEEFIVIQESGNSTRQVRDGCLLPRQGPWHYCGASTTGNS